MASPPSHSQAVLPNARILVLERIERLNESFQLFVSMNQAATCPACQHVSHSLHSWYSRRLQDLPWQGCSVQIVATVRRFRCRNAGCSRKVFCERLPGVAQAHARQTGRAAEIVRLIGYVAGGRAGQRLLVRLAIQTSDDTVLRRVRRPAGDPVGGGTVRNLGVDDWAWRKGQDYGTILVDLDLHRVVDLLPDRSSESLASWLQQRSGIATIARDRCGLYAEGARIGAPDANRSPTDFI